MVERRSVKARAAGSTPATGAMNPIIPIIFLIYGVVSLFVFLDKKTRDELSFIQFIYQVWFNGICGVVGWILIYNYSIITIEMNLSHVLNLLIGLLGITGLLPLTLHRMAGTGKLPS